MVIHVYHADVVVKWMQSTLLFMHHSQDLFDANLNADGVDVLQVDGITMTGVGDVSDDEYSGVGAGGDGLGSEVSSEHEHAKGTSVRSAD